MKTLFAALAAVIVLAAPAQAQQPGRLYHQAELDALLAPIALHPDGLVSQILIAATYPAEVAAAAGWSRAHPHLHGEEAVRAVQYEPWDPAVKALVAFPEVLARMDESPQWMHDLGQAFLFQEPHVMDTVQGLRRRAHAAGHLASPEYAVYEQGEALVVQPRTQIVYVRYYDPYVVYGPWWWPHYHPVFWRPFAPRPVFLAHGFFYSSPDWRHRHVRVVHRPVHVHHHHHVNVVPGKWQHRNQVASPAVQPPRFPEGRRQPPALRSTPPARVPESHRQPVVRQHVPAAHMPAAHGFSQPPQAVRERVQRAEPRREIRREEPRRHGEERRQGRQHRG